MDKPTKTSIKIKGGVGGLMLEGQKYKSRKVVSKKYLG